MNVAVITARGGSKRIPGKNIKIFAGKPMIAWPIEAAKKAGIFDKIIVSTDSDKISRIAEDWGAEVPFRRPSALSDEHTATAPVLEHALHWLCDQGISPKFACCLYPTAPFIQSDDILRGHQLLIETGAPAALSVTTFDFPILRGFKVHDDGSLAFNWPEHELTRSQDLPHFYHDAGQFYWVDVLQFFAQKKLLMAGARPVVLPRKRVQDLDTPEDWEVAELMAVALLKEGVK